MALAGPQHQAGDRAGHSQSNLHAEWTWGQPATPPGEGGGCHGFRRRPPLLPSRAHPSSCRRNTGSSVDGCLSWAALPLGFIFTPGNGGAARRVLGSRELQVLRPELPEAQGTEAELTEAELPEAELTNCRRPACFSPPSEPLWPVLTKAPNPPAGGCCWGGCHLPGGLACWAGKAETILAAAQPGVAPPAL